MKAWAIKHWTGALYVQTVRRTRSEAVASFKEQFGMSEEKWADDRKHGVHTPTRVEVTLITGAAQ